MIKANELREGNLIIANGVHNGKIMTVDRLGEQDVKAHGHRVVFFKEHSIGEFTKYCEPLILTPEWLERMGFELHKNGLYVTNDFWIEHDHLITPVYSDGSSFSRHIGKHIKYVHQLQNLYFALTGEEIAIKEPSQP